MIILLEYGCSMKQFEITGTGLHGCFYGCSPCKCNPPIQLFVWLGIGLGGRPSPVHPYLGAVDDFTGTSGKCVLARHICVFLCLGRGSSMFVLYVYCSTRHGLHHPSLQTLRNVALMAGDATSCSQKLRFSSGGRRAARSRPATTPADRSR